VMQGEPRQLLADDRLLGAYLGATSAPGGAALVSEGLEGLRVQG